MAAKKKGESPLEKIIVGIIITVASALILAWYSGVFNNAPVTQTSQSTPATGGRPGATKVK